MVCIEVEICKLIKLEICTPIELRMHGAIESKVLCYFWENEVVLRFAEPRHVNVVETEWSIIWSWVATCSTLEPVPFFLLLNICPYINMSCVQ